MLALFAPNSPAGRNILLALAVFATVLFGIQAYDIKPFGRSAGLAALSAVPREPARILKVTDRVEPVNELYAATLRTHARHDRLNGYTTKVFRERISAAYNSIPTYLLSIIQAELEKPEEEGEVRMEWVAWFSGDVVLLNPEVPLEIFLPPADFQHINVLATQDEEGFNAGVFFLRVDPWSVKMLTDVLLCPENRTEIQASRLRHQKALELTLRGPDFRDQVVYQPRQWYNAYVRDNQARGALLMHFNSPNGDKWAHMDEVLNQLAQAPGKFSIPVGTTDYPREIDEYWARLRAAVNLLPLAVPREKEDKVGLAIRRLQYTVTYEPDKEVVMRHALVQMKVALGMMDEGDIIG